MTSYDDTTSAYRLEELLSSFYRIQKVTKVNYHQYISKSQDDQWSIQMELLLRKQDPKNLVAVLSKELWCFSVNDDPIPELPQRDPKKNEMTEIEPDKSGEFTSDYSKPNLPPPYALFLKALRRAIYINMALESNSQVIPYGNACIPHNIQNGSPNPLILLEPHLFANGDLSIAACVKNIGLFSLREDDINDQFLREHALYLAPSAVRMYIQRTNKQNYLSPPPVNADLLLMTLSVSHGISFKDKKSVKWVTVIPYLNHLNGYTPIVASYLKLPPDVRSIVWPLELCYAQPAAKISSGTEEAACFESFQDVLEVIDDFIQVRQTSAYRTPGSSGNLGTNPLSTGGAFTEQFQQFYKNPSSVGNTHLRISPIGVNNNISPIYTGIDKVMSNTITNNESFNPAFNSTPNTNRDGNQLFNDRKQEHLETNLTPLKSEIERRIILGGSMDDIGNDKELFGDEDEDEDGDNDKISNDDESNHSNSSEIREELDVSMTNEDEDEDLFGDKDDTPTDEQKKSTKTDEITEDMFGMSDDEETNWTNSGTGDQFYMDSNESGRLPLRRPNMKRKYLDIPIDEMTLSNSPLYMDPGAPLPVETPRDRRKSVFAPLTFNPIIENNVDNKYKNGGKFSISPGQNDEALKFDISTGEFSSSEDEDTDSSFEGLDYNSLKQEQEPTISDPPYLHFQSIQGMQDSVSPNLLSNNYQIASEQFNKDGSNSIWKLPHQELQSPLKNIDQSLKVQDNSTDIVDGLHSIQTTGEETPLTDQSSRSEGIDDKKEKMTDKYQFNSLPFLLRHMPLSSIPEIFITTNPTITRTKNDQESLDLLCEQIVFDFNILENLRIPQIQYEGVSIDQDGLISNTMHKLFPQFEQLDGNEMITKFYTIKEPFVYVKKHHETIKIRSNSQPFAKFLNLKPPEQIKNFKFLLLTTSFKDDCASFVSTLSQTYTSQEFGFCELLKLNSDEPSGLIYLKDFEKNKLLLLAAQIVSYCSTNKTSNNDATLMIILPLADKSLFKLLSSIKVFQIIRNEVKAKIPNIDLFLKTVPLDFIKNPLTSVDEYYNVCASIFNILMPKSSKFTTIAHKLPDEVKFRTLQAHNEPSYIHYDAYIHLAYSRSIDKQWIFGALSDSSGKENIIKSWYVGTSKSLFDEACQQLWNLALGLAGKKYGKICLILTRLDGILPDDELMNWRRLSGRNVHLAVVCVDDNTKVSFYDGDKLYPTFKPIYKDEKLSNTFNRNNMDDYEIRNVDDDIHGVIFRNPFPLANSQHRCAIKSGALVKFKRTAGDSLLDKFEVNLLNCPHSDSTRLLELILQEFRTLAGLNVWFGVSNGEDAHIPWHVLAVKKMMRTLVHINVDTEHQQEEVK